MTGRVLAHSRITASLWVLLGALLLAVALGWATAGLHLKAIYVLVLPLVLALLIRVGSRVRFAMLVVAVATISLQNPTLLPLGASYGLALVVALVVAQWSSRVSSRVTHRLTVSLPLVLYSGLGIAATYAHGEIGRAAAVCLTPVVLFLAAAAFARGPREALRVQAACVIGGVVYLLMVFVAEAVGWSTTSLPGVTGDPGVTGMSRLGAQGWTLLGGVFAMKFYPTWLAALLAVAMPAACLLFCRAKGHQGARLWWAAAVVFLAFSLLLTAGRAGVIGALVGITVALIASGRFAIRRVLAWSAAAVVLALAFGSLIAGLLSSVAPSANVARLVGVLSPAVARSGNLAYRVNVLLDTLRLAGNAPLGHGFNYWSLRGTDDSIVFAMLLNGVGPLAFLCLAALLLALLASFVRRARGSVSDGRDAVAIGLGVLAAGLVAGVGSHSVLIEPVQSFMFWGFAMAAYWGAHPLEPKGSARPLHLSAGELLPQGAGGVRTPRTGTLGSGAVFRP